MKKILFAFFFLSLISCSNYNFVQVYEIQSENCSKDNDVLTYSNDDCSVMYDFWSEGGDGGFIFHNKTNKNIYLVMSMSSFIKNGMVNDYDSFLMVETKTPDAHLSARALCVPPMSWRKVKGFCIFNNVKMECDNRDSNYPKTSSAKITYTKDDTPMCFSNRLAYCLDSNLNDIKYVENIFWVSSLQNHAEYSLIEKVEVKDCETGTVIKANRNIMESPDRFYNNYSINSFSSNSKYKPFDQVGIFSVKKSRNK